MIDAKKLRSQKAKFFHLTKIEDKTWTDAVVVSVVFRIIVENLAIITDVALPPKTLIIQYSLTEP
ncbi:MAG: hypothetical protein IKT27_02665 [Clostridia bacterium]|nr:hypothetical protein [Clostridia bacterium]